MDKQNKPLNMKIIITVFIKIIAINALKDRNKRI